jgi:transcriptional regulator with XRE-family HTH domain
MPTELEKKAFAGRLRLALNRDKTPIKGATDLALRFNLRHRSSAPISPQTAHKWISGRTIPTTDKLKTLSAWLDVPEHWLRFGPPPAAEPPIVLKDAKGRKLPPSPETLALAAKIHTLLPHQRYLVEELITQFYTIPE